MPSPTPQIVAFGGGGFSMEWGNTMLDDHVLALSGATRPRVCFLPTASGDADHYIVRFYRAFPASRCEPSHISLFRRETGVEDPRSHLLSQDVIYVGGGSVISLLGTWSAHGIDDILREAWAAGVLLCGGSAGSLCWFTDAVSGFHAGAARHVRGLGLLPWSNAVHYSDEPKRRVAFRTAIAEGMVPGYAVSDSAALHFVGTELSEVVASRPGACAYYVSADGTGGASEAQLPVRYLGSDRAASTGVVEGAPVAA